MDYFSPEDLRGCLEGREGIDWEEVKQMAEYMNTSLPKDHQLVGEFWEFEDNLGLDNGRTLLFFITGSQAGGLKLDLQSCELPLSKEHPLVANTFSSPL